MYKSWSVVFWSTLSLTCSRRSVKMVLSDCPWMRTLRSPPILPNRSSGSHQQIDRLLYNHLLPRHLVTTPMPQLMSCTPQWLLQSMIMIIRMFARVYFGISAVYKVWCGEVSYCFVGMLPSCISMMSYFSEPSPWILIQPLLSWIWQLWKKKFRYFMAGYVRCALVEICPLWVLIIDLLLIP